MIYNDYQLWIGSIYWLICIPGVAMAWYLFLRNEKTVVNYSFDHSSFKSGYESTYNPNKQKKSQNNSNQSRFQPSVSRTYIDYFRELELPADSSKDDIKKSYRRLAMKYHPDRGGDTKKMQQIQEAYRILFSVG